MIEQHGSLKEPFNRAKLFNIGVIEGIFNHEIRNKATSNDEYPAECYCLILHDVDMLPVSDYSYSAKFIFVIFYFFHSQDKIIKSFYNVTGKLVNSLFLPTNANSSFIIC